MILCNSGTVQRYGKFIQESGRVEDQIHALIYWLCQRARPSKKSCLLLPFAQGLIQFCTLKPALYGGGMPANLTGTRHDSWLGK